MINDKGLLELEKFLDELETADRFGGLVQCVDKEDEILWLCEDHRDGYRPVSDSPQSLPRPIENTTTKQEISNTSGPSNGSNGSHSPISPISPIPPNSTISSNSIINSRWDYAKFCTRTSTGPFDPYFALEYVCKILGEVIENIIASEKNHFRRADVLETAQKMRWHLDSYKRCYWNDNDQKVQFISILKNQVHIYIRFIWLILRYCAVNDHVVTNPLSTGVRKITIWYNDIFEIGNIIKAGKLFNNHLSDLIAAWRTQNNQRIKNELNTFENDPYLKYLKANIDNSTIALSRWYRATGRIHFGQFLTEIKSKGGGGLFDTTRRLLDNITVAGKSLKNKYLNKENFLCIEKEIRLYNERQLNDSDYIIKFHGYSIHHCKCTLFYDYAYYGDLFGYFQENHDLSENLLEDWKNKIKLAWGISQGVKYLHDQKIVHLDLRSANILLNYNEKEKTLMPKVSNFLWSRDFFSGRTSTYPIITMFEGEEVWKRWYDPDRLHHMRHYHINIVEFLRSSDIYSLGLLFWEIAWCKAENLPFKDIPIEKLYNHLQNNNCEKLPEMSEEYRSWKNLINEMWMFKPGDRCDINTVESAMRRLYEGRTDSASSITLFP